MLCPERQSVAASGKGAVPFSRAPSSDDKKYVHSLIRVSKVRTNTLVSTYVKKAVRVSVRCVITRCTFYMLLRFLYHVIPVVSPVYGVVVNIPQFPPEAQFE